MARVSVIIPTFNRADLLKAALESVVTQSYTDYEVIVVDDGSTDDTKNVVENISKGQSNIRYIYQKKSGRSSARNVGIRESKSELITFLDSDDIYLANKLKIQVQSLDDHPNYGMAYTNYLVMDENGIIIDGAGNSTENLSGQIYPELLFFKGTIITTPSVILRSSLLQKTGLFNPALDICEDLDLWRRVARITPVLQIKEPLVIIRHKNDNNNIWELLSGRRKYYRRAVFDDPSLNCGFYRKLLSEMYYKYGMHAVKNKNFSFSLYAFMNLMVLYPVFFTWKIYRGITKAFKHIIMPQNR